MNQLSSRKNLRGEKEKGKTLAGIASNILLTFLIVILNVK